MTAPAPPPPEAKPPRTWRPMVGWTLAILAALGLAAASMPVYRALRLRYAMYRVRNPVPGMDGFKAFESWYLECHEAARMGNRAAMNAVLDPLSRGGTANCPIWFGEYPSSASYASLWQEQPELLADALDRRSDAEVLRMLTHVQLFCVRPFLRRPESFVSPFKSGREAIEAFEAYETHGPSILPSLPFDRRQIAERALAYARRRFAAEMTEAGKPKGTEQGK